MLVRLVLALALLASSTQSLAAETQYVGSTLWTSDHPLHGGYSGLEVNADGSSFTAISDHGSIAKGTFIRNEAGIIQSVTDEQRHALKGVNSDSIPHYDRDAEGLAIAPNGQIFISFEGIHKILRYPTDKSRAKDMKQHPAFESLQRNSSLEALAITDQGHILVVPERSGGEMTPFPVYRFDGSNWDAPYTIPRSANYLPVGMDVGPDGKLYLLERWFRGIGFSSRVRRFEFAASGLINETILLDSSLGAHDNLEGLAVWHDGADIRLTMVSDNNFKVFQVTEFVEYRVTD